jgi:integrase/recombinase XerD
MIQASSPIDIADELIERYRKDCVRQGMAPSSVKSYVSSILIFNQYLKNHGLEPLQVDKDVLRDFLDHLLEQNLVQKTIKGYFTKISSFYDFLVYEDYIESNPAPAVRKRYVRSYKDNDAGQMRKLISIKEMTMLINSTLDIRDKAVITLLAKTGIRRNELITLDIDDIDWVEQSIRLKPTAKRTNRTVFFDDETAFILKSAFHQQHGRTT